MLQCLCLLQLILNKVLLIGSSTQTIIGRPIVTEAAVHAVVEEHVSVTLILLSCVYGNIECVPSALNFFSITLVSWVTFLAKLIPEEERNFKSKQLLNSEDRQYIWVLRKMSIGIHGAIKNVRLSKKFSFKQTVIQREGNSLSSFTEDADTNCCVIFKVFLIPTL